MSPDEDGVSASFAKNPLNVILNYVVKPLQLLCADAQKRVAREAEAAIRT